MITRAIIEDVISPFLYKVRIPIFDRVETATQKTSFENLLSAPASVPKGYNDQFQKGDIVFIAFENNDLESPIIIGHLYREALFFNTSGPIIDARNLNVSGNTNLSSSTKIGDINYQKLYYLNNVQQDLQNSLDSLATEIVELQESLNSQTNSPATETSLGGIKLANGIKAASDGTVSFGPSYSSGKVSYLDRDTINACRGNRFECLSHSCISSKLQYWGKTEDDPTEHWIDTVAANYISNSNLFNTSNTSGIDIGDDSDTTNSVYQVVIDLDLTQLPSTTSLYTNIDKLYIWVSTNGGTLSCQVLGSRPTNPDFHQLCEETPLTGWSGSNIIPLSLIINKNSNINDHTKNQYNKLRFIFKGTKSGSNRFPKLFKLAAYGSDGWSFQNNMANFDHMYSWDNECNVTFPKLLQAQSPLEGVELTEDFIDDNRVVTIGYLKAIGLI